jgi:hypothetical protein
MLSVAACTHQPWSSSLRAFDARSAACCHLARGFLIEKSTAQALPVLQRVNMAELKASHENAHAIVLVGLILESVGAAPSDPPFKYKKAAPSLLQTTSSQPPFHFSKHPYPLNLIAKMASAESDLVRCYDNGRALHANIGLKRTQKMCGNMIAGSKSVKRQASPPEGSRGRRSRCSIMKPC